MIKKIVNYVKYLKKKTKKYKKISYSFNEVDLIINYIFKDQNRTYVDIGAQHPISNNNTYLLFKRGWSGVNIDLDKKNIDLFNISRPRDINLNFAISDKQQEVKLYFYHDASPINTLNKQVADFQKASVKSVKKINSYTLNNILEKID